MASYRKRENGLWEYRISYKTIDGKYRRKEKGGFKTKKLAQAAALDVEKKLTQNILTDGEVTLYDFVKTWSEVYKRPYVKDKTWETYTKNFRHVKNYFQEMKVKDITPLYYQKKLNEFGEKYAQETLEKFHYQIKGAMKVAVREEVIRFNFADDAKVKSQIAIRDEEDDFLEEHELKALLALTREKVRYVTYFTLYLLAVTGLRFSEVMGLTWNDVDFENGILDINKAFDYSNTQDFCALKNDPSERKVPIDSKTIEVLREYRKNHWQANIKNRICFGVSNSSCNKIIKKIVGRPVRNHSLRHTYASFLILNGVDIVTISKLLGHESPDITLKVYTHQMEALAERNFEKIKNIFLVA
ncbi:prophage LambdaSa2%2C site-specific recombinase phage integrase family protein [Streptococcus suis]|uniref:Prophage LambdaSa2, site-specific recombinase phage integrase family protein n=2 Tax=Streptococcus suis TaxID=1307 RepID=A0A822W1I1_STRSU|nr:site-specific integrase [Streptococcus suis]MBS7850295.1 site-specific integrase [Streptococcus suis]MBS8001292.1 site-specific integrase [Streptococcus suis]MBS8027473.1 site-specific integrase [Streptococcus suis]MDG3114429.1 site-specific integrase [Streptococcus suis]MDG3222582.1 site-specific integrase [Streptococcus suis]